MMLHPPCAEDELYCDAADSEGKAGCVAAYIPEVESPVVEYDGSDERLAQIVGQTHLTVWGDLHQPVLSRCPVIKEGDAGYDEEHHRDVFPHVQSDIQTL